jgi:hypothetical protein
MRRSALTHLIGLPRPEGLHGTAVHRWAVAWTVVHRFARACTILASVPRLQLCGSSVETFR